MEYIIRKATEFDADQIREIFLECFGFLDATMLPQIGSGCLVAESDGNILSVGGITQDTQSTEFLDGYEVLWTGTKKEYRKQGIAVNILRKAISERADKTKPVYCSCLRINSQKINLFSVMQRLGFKLVYQGKSHAVFPYFKACRSCVNKNYDRCECFEDLYVLDPP